jgi:ribosomal protein L6P/L9E
MQGYSSNLELRGIGFKGKMESLQVRRRQERESTSNGDGGAITLASSRLRRRRDVRPFGGMAEGTCVESRLNFKLGFSHNLIYTTSQSVKLDVMEGSPPSVTVFGITPSVVNQVAYEIYAYKKPEPYKGKGIRYIGEKFFGKKGRGKE